MKSTSRFFEKLLRPSLLLCKSILTVSLFCAVCVAFHAAEPAAKWRTVFENDFRPLSHKTLSENNKKSLRERNIEPEKVSATDFPAKWRCDVSTFPQQWMFEDQKEAGLLVNVDPSILIYTTSLEVSRDAFKYELEATGTGKLEAGVSFVEAPGLSFIREVPRGADGSFHFSYEAPAGTANLVSIRVRISGAVNLLSAKLTAKASADTSVGEGTITNISFMPPVADIPEDNCYFTADFKMKQTIEGKPIPQIVRVLLPGIFRRNLATGAYFHRNSRCRITVKPYESCVIDQKMTRQINTLQESPVPLYLATEILELSNFSLPNEHISVAEAAPVVPEKYVSRFLETENGTAQATEDRSTQFVNAQIAAFLKMRDRLDDDTLTGLAKKFNGAWAEQYEEGEKLEDGRGWFYDGNSGWALHRDYDITAHSAITPNVLKTLTSFRDFLHAHGCRLLVQIVPSADSVAARRILPEFKEEPDIATLAVFQQLLKSGIESIPAYSVLYGADTENTPALYLYSVSDALNDCAQDALAAQVAKYLSAQYPEGTFPALLKETDFTQKKRALLYKTISHQWPKNVTFNQKLAGTTVFVSELSVKNAQFVPNPDSSVLVIGNGIVHEPMLLCNYAAYLAKHTEMIPDALAIYGKMGWIHALSRVFENPDRYIKGKKAVVLPIYADDLCIRHNTPDFRQIDESNLICRGKSLLTELKVTDLRTNIDTIKLPAEQKAIWRNFFFTTAYNATFSENKLSKKLRPVSIPENHRGKDGLICRIRAAVHFSVPDAVITVNGEDYKIYASSPAEPQWQVIDVPVKADTEKLTVTITAPSKDAIVAIRDITLFGSK